MKRRRYKRRRLRVNEELDPSTKNNVLSDLEKEVRNTVESIMLAHSVESKGLSPQQAAYVAQEIDHVVQDTLQDYRTESASRLTDKEREYIERNISY